MKPLTLKYLTDYSHHRYEVFNAVTYYNDNQPGKHTPRSRTLNLLGTYSSYDEHNNSATLNSVAAIPRRKPLQMPARTRVYHPRIDTYQGSLDNIADTLSALTSKLGVIENEQQNQQTQITNLQTYWKSEVTDLSASIKELGGKIEEKNKPKTMTWIGIFSAAFAVITSMITVGVVFVNMNIKEETSPLHQRIASLEQATSNLHDMNNRVIKSGEADARSQQDRDDINRRLSNLENSYLAHVATSREQYASTEAKFTEVETQFKGLTGMLYWLWEKIMGSAFPIIPRESPSHLPNSEG